MLLDQTLIGTLYSGARKGHLLDMKPKNTFDKFLVQLVFCFHNVQDTPKQCMLITEVFIPYRNSKLTRVLQETRNDEFCSVPNSFLSETH